jgi:hypothetical protein
LSNKVNALILLAISYYVFNWRIPNVSIVRQINLQLAGKKDVVLYDGDHLLPFGEKLYGVPISALWGNV